MTKAWIATWALIIGLIAVSCNACPEAKASPLCAHRGAEHAAQHHETREGDSRWHVAHGDLPTCNLDKPDDVDDRDHERDDPRWRYMFKDHDKSDDRDEGDGTSIPRRDHQGFHCTWHGCG